MDLSPCLVWLHENFAYLKALSRELIDAIVAASEKDTLDSLLINLIRTKAQISARNVGFAESLLFHGAKHPPSWSTRVLAADKCARWLLLWLI